MPVNTNTKKVRLSITETAFVTTAAEANRGPKVRTLVVSQELVQRMVNLAESAGWKNPDRALNLQHLPRAAVITLVTKLREALTTEPDAPSNSKARTASRNIARDYFAVARNRRELARVLEFFEPIGELNVEAA
ncbi:MAG TPA: hypothetical protein VGE74_15055 [Gemmata sp.]